MALKKSDLYRSLWQSCDELRGGMDASQYKDYILTLLFMKYVTDKAKHRDSLIEVPTGGSFADMVASVGDPEIGDRINKIIGRLADENDLRGVIDLADFNDDEKLGKGKEMQDRLGKLVSIFNDLDFSGSTAEGDDLLGDAYEYLMRHFATESGKSKGQFYTPAEVSRVLARVIGIGPDTKPEQTVCDPTCGSGSLLLKAAAESPQGLTIYGQEKDNATWALARMNAILHSHEDHDIRKGDTITSPQFVQGDVLQTFDFQVSNPPFSVKSWGNGLEKEYGRFDNFGRPPEKNGDYAFLLHVVKSMSSIGRAAVILPHGVLFRGNAEATIRKQLLKSGVVKGVIGLPPNLFYGTGIPACIIVLDKNGADERTGVFMIDASKGFIKDGPKNRLRSQDIHKIVDVFNKQIEVDRYSRMVPHAEITAEANDFNLNIPRYIDSSDPEDLQDLNAHLYGGIPERDIDALAAYWDAFPSLRKTLFKPNRNAYADLAVAPTQVQEAILGSSEFAEFAAQAQRIAADWFMAHRPALAAIGANTRPTELIATLGDDLLERFKPVALLDEYDVYERLLSYWHQTIHDDVFMVMLDGWLKASSPRKAIENKDRKLSEEPDLTIGSGKNADKYKLDLIPPHLIVARYFAGEQAEVEKLEAKSTAASLVLAEHIEEHAVEDGLLAGALDDDKITKKSVSDRLKAAKMTDAPDEDEVAALNRVGELFSAEATARKAVKDARAALDGKTLGKYADLDGTDVQLLLLEDKWLATVEARVSAQADGLARNLVSRIEGLGERYGHTVSALEAATASAAAAVEVRLTAIAGSGSAAG
jgi:type I restriction enzyme M protein